MKTLFIYFSLSFRFTKGYIYLFYYFKKFKIAFIEEQLYFESLLTWNLFIERTVHPAGGGDGVKGWKGELLF